MLKGSTAVALTHLTLNLLKGDSKFIILIPCFNLSANEASKILLSDSLYKDS